jgi:hypothetical protein
VDCGRSFLDGDEACADTRLRSDVVNISDMTADAITRIRVLRLNAWLNRNFVMSS